MCIRDRVYDDKMLKTIEVVKSNFASVRAGRANAGVLDRIMVEYYGTPTPLNQVAAVSSPDPRTLVIQPWDATLLRAIEKAIQTSDLGINPQNDGRVIRLAFPQLTEERRKDCLLYTSDRQLDCLLVRNGGRAPPLLIGEQPIVAVVGDTQKDLFCFHLR